MLLKDFAPSPALREFVRLYRIVHFVFDQTAIVPAKAYSPKPEEVLHFFLTGSFSIERQKEKKEYQPPILLIGQRTGITIQHTERSVLNFQIVFQPTALFRLTGIPAYELTNQFVDATCLFKDIRQIYDQLQEATSYAQMLQIGENFLQDLVSCAKQTFHHLDRVANHLIAAGGNISLNHLADQTCLSTKQFQRKFWERAGIHPKLFSRIIRFNKAYNLKNGYPEMDWLSIAIQCGYYDYQHLLKDYKEFTGFTPHQFHLQEAKGPEAVLGLTEEVYRSRLHFS